MRWLIAPLVLGTATVASAGDSCQDGPDMIVVIVTIETLAAGTVIREDDLYAALAPCALVHPSMFRSPEHVVGATVAQTLEMNTLIRWDHLHGDGYTSTSASIPNGMRMVHADLAPNGFAVAVGDEVDAVIPTSNGAARCTLSRRVHVVHVDTSRATTAVLLAVPVAEVPRFLTDPGQTIDAFAYNDDTPTTPPDIPDCSSVQ